MPETYLTIDQSIRMRCLELAASVSQSDVTELAQIFYKFITEKENYLDGKVYVEDKQATTVS